MASLLLKNFLGGLVDYVCCLQPTLYGEIIKKLIKNYGLMYVRSPKTASSSIVEMFKRNFKKVIEECKRVLKPSGVMLISVPSFLPERLCWNYSKKYMQSPGGHIRIFKREYLKKSLEDQGLKIFKFHREHALHSFYWIFKAKNNMEDSKFTKSIHEILIKQIVW